MNAARLLLPAVRWSAEHGFHHQWEEIERALERGVGGFILFGGEAGAVRGLTDEMRARSPHPLLIASDLERGAGQQFLGATPLPPAAALGSLDEPEAVRQAARITARDARAVGVNWVFAPVADVDLEPENPVIGTRAYGHDPASVATLVAEWVRGCREGGALSCAKHFPGHGRTVADSHVELPSVAASRELLEEDLRPFTAALEAGVDAMMTAHVAYPALDPSGAAATVSGAILTGLLRERMRYDGLIVTDAVVMKGLVHEMDEGSAGALAIAAGCDLLLYPDDAQRLADELEHAVQAGTLDAARIADALRRVDAAARRVADTPEAQPWGREEDLRWALRTAVRTLRVSRGEPRLPAGAVRLVEVDDDLGGPFTPYPRSAFPAALRAAGVEIRDDAPPLVALYADIRAWKGRPGISGAARERVAALVRDEPEATVVLFSHPRLAAELPNVRHLLSAWGGESVMQEAAAAWLTGTEGALASSRGGFDR